MRRLPPLNALRAFEAAARLESFNRAAEQLHVTPSAISHQMRVLEEFLGVALFRRGPRSVELTKAGRTFLPPVQEALQRIAEAAERLRMGNDERILTVSSAPDFAMGWLIPRLIDFRRAHPTIEVRLDTSLELVDFATSDADIAIRYTIDPHRPGLTAHCLLREQLVVVCAPVLAGDLRQPVDIRRAILLHSRSRPGLWRAWLAAVGITAVDTERGPQFPNDTLSLEAAVNGLGLALVERPLAERRIAEGRLVTPFEIPYTGRYGYYLVYPEVNAGRVRIVAFRDWLLDTITREGPEKSSAAPVSASRTHHENRDG